MRGGGAGKGEKSSPGAPTAADLHWAHTLAYLFTLEGGGDLTNPAVHDAAQAALTLCENRMTALQGAGGLRPATHAEILHHLTTVRGAFSWASRPGVLAQAQRCTCGAFQGPVSAEPKPPTPDRELQDAIRDAATWTAGANPQAAAEWIQGTVNRPGNAPDQMIYFAAGMLANTLDDGNPWTAGPHPETADDDLDLAVRTSDALVLAARDREGGKNTAADALNALRHADPDRHRRRRHIALHRILTSLGAFLLDRAHTVARVFHHNGGGDLADPAVQEAAQGAAYAFDKFVFANMRVTERLDEKTYLRFVTQVIGATEDFALASRYAAP
jgi:hypothetical protein